MVKHRNNDLLQAATAIAKKAGEIILEGQQLGFDVDFKGKHDLVTTYDKKSEHFIVESIKKQYPTHSILGEEGTEHNNDTSDYRWIIDPIDGTTNFAHGFPLFCVSIGIEYKGDLIVGVIDAPALERCYTASKGNGAFCNDKPIETSMVETLEQALVAANFKHSEFNKLAPLLGRLEQNSHGLRRTGSAALNLCFVADGSLDMSWGTSLNPWDIAAGAIIVDEAGGTISMQDGSAFNLDGDGILATNGHLHQETVAHLQATN